MKLNRFLILAIFLFSFFELKAQKDSLLFYLGGGLGYSYNMLNADFRAFPGVPSCCPRYRDGSGGGLSGGVFIEYPINDKFSFRFRINYSNVGGNLQKNEKIGNTPIVANGDTTVTAIKTKYNVDSYLNLLGFEPYLEYNIWKGLSCNIGGRFGYLAKSKISQYEKLTEPNGAVFLDGRMVRNDYHKIEMPEAKSFQFHLSAGALYSAPLGGGAFIEPQIRYFAPFTNLSSVDFKTSNLEFSVDLKFPINKHKRIEILPPVYYRDTIVQSNNSIAESSIKLIDSIYSEIKSTEAGAEIIKPEIKLKYLKETPTKCNTTMSFEYYGVDKNGAKQQTPTIVIEETETEEYFPLLTQIFFADGSSDLMKTSQKLISKKETATFSEKKLQWGALEIYSDMLNIVGERLSKQSSTKIRLVGTTSQVGLDAENEDIAINRAESVKKYLTDVWGIAPDRIKTESNGLPANPSNNAISDGVEENRRVEIYSDDKIISSAVDLKEIRKTSNPPIVEISPEVKSDCEIVSMSGKISQMGKVYRDWNSISNKNYQWTVADEPTPSMDAPTLIEFRAINTKGDTIISKKEATVSTLTIQKKRERIEGDKKIERFSIILFDFDKADLKQGDYEIIKMIKSRIKPNSEISIVGYSDRTGSDEYNRELSKRRAEKTLEAIDMPRINAEAKGVGKDYFIFDNNSPEGRAYSRTVQVEIKTPIK